MLTSAPQFLLFSLMESLSELERFALTKSCLFDLGKVALKKVVIAPPTSIISSFLLFKIHFCQLETTVSHLWITVGKSSPLAVLLTPIAVEIKQERWKELPLWLEWEVHHTQQHLGRQCWWCVFVCLSLWITIHFITNYFIFLIALSQFIHRFVGLVCSVQFVFKGWECWHESLSLCSWALHTFGLHVILTRRLDHECVKMRFFTLTSQPTLSHSFSFMQPSAPFLDRLWSQLHLTGGTATVYLRFKSILFPTIRN